MYPPPTHTHTQFVECYCSSPRQMAILVRGTQTAYEWSVRGEQLDIGLLQSVQDAMWQQIQGYHFVPH